MSISITLKHEKQVLEKERKMIVEKNEPFLTRYQKQTVKRSRLCNRTLVSNFVIFWFGLNQAILLISFQTSSIELHLTGSSSFYHFLHSSFFYIFEHKRNFNYRFVYHLWTFSKLIQRLRSRLESGVGEGKFWLICKKSFQQMV